MVYRLPPETDDESAETKPEPADTVAGRHGFSGHPY
jgi:hypothetical protein